MLIFEKNKDLTAYLASYQNVSVGFVPTMGALHRGHLSLIENALLANDIVVVSIFVNPTQFNNTEDLEKYPRTLEADVLAIKSLSGNIVVYAPSVSDIYGEQMKSESFSFDGLENEMEGKYRPGHFDGVGTIVRRLFEIVKPTQAYFGEKDYQQLLIVKKLVVKKQLPIKIHGCPIYREANGLAMSSRNERLSETARKEAGFIYETLSKIKNDFASKSIIEINTFIKQLFDKNPIFRLDYFQIADQDTLKPTTEKEKNKKYRAFIAVFVENVRLIDTIPLN
jgi:pantoate--beta-alanine ligase